MIADPKRPTQLLVTPTSRVAGLESPELTRPGAPDYWWLAWSSRAWLDCRAGRKVASEAIGLAVNSAPGRTQDQLHIHMDRLRPTVRAVIDADFASVSETWAELPRARARGHRYRARWLAADALASTNPFGLLAGNRVVGKDRAIWTLVLVAAHRLSGDRGFVLLTHKADLGAYDLAAGEELLDHRCAALSEP